MADQTLSITHSPNGVPTDYDAAPVLADAGGTYGLREVVSGTVTIAANVSGGTFARTSAGSYSLPLTGLTAGLAYQYSLKRVYLGATSYTARVFTAQSSIAAGYYATGDELGIEFGKRNVNLADFDNQNDLVALWARIQSYLQGSDDWINRVWDDAGRTVPIQQNEKDFAPMKDCAIQRTMAFLYQARGQADNDKNMFGKMQASQDYAEGLLRARVTLWQQKGLSPSAGDVDTPLETYPDAPSYGTNGVNLQLTPWG